MGEVESPDPEAKSPRRRECDAPPLSTLPAPSACRSEAEMFAAAGARPGEQQRDLDPSDLAYTGPWAEAVQDLSGLATLLIARSVVVGGCAIASLRCF